MPAYDEADGLASVLAELFREVDRLEMRDDIAVLVVDDGSTDETPLQLARISEEEPRLTYTRHATNQGFGAAVKTGLGHTRSRYALMIPADGQWNPSELPLFVSAAADGIALALGVREAREVYGGSRRILSAVYAFLVRILFGASCRDYAWVHLYDLSRVRWREPGATTAFYPVEIALRTTLELPAASASYRQIPSRMRPRLRGTTKVATPRVIFRMLVELLGAAWRIRYRPTLRRLRRAADPARAR